LTFTTAVVGGGLSGLVRARSLVARGEEVVLFEESERAGGVVRSERSNGYLLELGPTTVRPTTELSALVDELGLAGEVVLADARLPRYVDFGGRLHALPTSPGAFFGTKLLSARGKLRLLREPFVPRGDPSRETVQEFFTRRLGPEVAERFVEPFVSGIWAGRSDALAAAHAFPALVRAETELGSLTRAGLASFSRRTPAKGARRGLLSFRSGLEALPRRIAEELGPRVRFGTRVESVRRTGKRWVLSAGGRAVEADAVCLATPARDAARLLKDLDPEAAAALETIPHPPLLVLHLAMRGAMPLRGFGHLVVPQAGRRILGAVWSSNLFSGRAPEGNSLLTVFLGGARDPAAIDLPDADLVATAARDLDAAFASRTDFEPVRITRYSRALPQYDLAHGERVAHLTRAERAMPGLTILGNYRGGVSVGDVVRAARTF
jgi:oxygen-dependent protoporphyrinogen oxidase